MAPDAEPSRAKEWAAHCWEGLDLWAWLRLAWHNHFAVSPKLWYVAASVSMVSCGHTLLRIYQDLLFAQRIRRTPLVAPPVFILGHWRAGTTLLHEWLILDPRHTYPNTYQCFSPHNFLLTEQLARRYLGFMLPARRPMDNMAVGWERPQEDEFALCMLGAASPYQKIAFPNHDAPFPGALDLDGLTLPQRRQWQRIFYRYLQTLTFHDPRRLILKSPPHSARIPHLLELFPNARFIHIVRDPYDVFPSTIKLWTALWRQQGLQVPNYAGLEAYVYGTFEHLYAKLEAGKALLSPGQLYEVRYEDLLRDPVGHLRQLYHQLDLGDFESLRPRFVESWAKQQHYERNRHTLTTEQAATITQRWGEVIRRYGYPLRT